MLQIDKAEQPKSEVHQKDTWKFFICGSLEISWTHQAKKIIASVARASKS